MSRRTLFIALLSFAVFLTGSSGAKTLVLEGTVDGTIEVSEERTFSAPPGGLKRLSFRFANPANTMNATLRQSVTSNTVDYRPKPSSVRAEKDRFGNSFTAVEWDGLSTEAVITERYRVSLAINLKDVKSSAPFPLPAKDIPEKDAVFLKATGLVESGDPRIKALASSLTAGAASEQSAVSSILNWVVDNVKYRTPIPEYGALWTLEKRTGNCQNFSHLGIALLRASGIPARIVGGVSLGKTWKVPLEDGTLLQSIGQGGHAWIEVFYPDLGWVPYDAQQSHLFVGPRHIKQTHGLDSEDINDSWRASPLLPSFRDDISADFLKDDIRLSLKNSSPSPANYIMTASFAPLKSAPVPLAPPVPAPVVPPPAVIPPEPQKILPEAVIGEEVKFGNLDFPTLMDFYVGIRDRGAKTFDKETAEYVTGEAAFAQAFTVERAMKLTSVSLAMHKFGGRFGSLWLDVVSDRGGRPSVLEGIRSLTLNLDSVSYTPGYKWFEFVFSTGATDEDPVLKPGRYWIILRHSKDAVVNWFYTPGNAYGQPDDARSTLSGIDWSYVLNADFNFMVRGVLLKGSL